MISRITCLLVFVVGSLSSGIYAQAGFGSVRSSVGAFMHADSAIRSAIHDSVFPGAVVVVGNGKGIVYERAYGQYDYSDSAKPMTINTVFDLASLTKVMATTPAAMKLHEEGRLLLDKAVTDYIPAFAQNGKAQVTIRNLLLHNSGLPPGKPFHRTCRDENEALDSLFAMPLSYKTGTKTVYSDLGLIVIGKVIEGVTGMSLDVFVRKTFYEPLGMQETTFNPPDSLWKRIAPTEVEYNVRVTNKLGRVRNPITRLMNGVTGHAGLFSTGENLSKMALLLLNDGIYSGRRYLLGRTITLFTRSEGTQSSRALGWDTKDANDNCAAGHYFSSAAYGHTGFTGTSVWIDPVRRFYVVLLTNRTYQMRDTNRILVVRPLIHDAIMQSYNILENNGNPLVK